MMLSVLRFACVLDTDYCVPCQAELVCKATCRSEPGDIGVELHPFVSRVSSANTPVGTARLLGPLGNISAAV